MTQDINAILQERGQRYGDFKTHSVESRAMMTREDIRDAILNCARCSIPQASIDEFSHFGERQRPLLPLFLALLDAMQVTASAIADNAWDASEPIPLDFAIGCQEQIKKSCREIMNATECPNRSRWHKDG